MSKKLGNIEKFILLDLYSQVQQGHGLREKDRSQIIFNLFCIRHGFFEMNFSGNVKNQIVAFGETFGSDREYNSLQVAITRSLKALETVGLVATAIA